MNAKTTLVSDVREKVMNGKFSAWTGDDPDNWIVVGESGNDPEVSQVGAGEGHGGAGTGMCNLYASDGAVLYMYQDIALVVGKKYQVSVNVDTVTTGGVAVDDPQNEQWTPIICGTTGVKTTTFVATQTSARLRVLRQAGAAYDVTFDEVSVKSIRGKLLIC